MSAFGFSMFMLAVGFVFLIWTLKHVNVNTSQHKTAQPPNKNK